MKREKLKFMIITAVCAGLLLSGCGTAGKKSPDAAAGEGKGTYRQITQEEAKSVMENESDYLLLDVRTLEEYAEGHIPGAICVPNETIGTDPIPELPDKNQKILIYCRSGNRSRQAAEKLLKQGYTEVFDFGGVNTWTGELVSGEEEKPAEK